MQTFGIAAACSNLIALLKKSKVDWKAFVQNLLVRCKFPKEAMKLKDVLGLMFIATGTSVGTVGYKILGLQWYFGACIFLAIGLILIWGAARDRKIRESLNEVGGDWGDTHYVSGSHATDDVDTGGHE